MFAIGGLVFVFLCVFGGYVLAGVSGAGSAARIRACMATETGIEPK